MATFFQRSFSAMFFVFKHKWLLLLLLLAAVIIDLVSGTLYNRWDDDVDRGAVGITDGEFGEDYATPIYLEQGWSEADSLRFYNTTQGSALLPYDFFEVLEEEKSEALFRSDKNIDKYRYLPQKPTFSNPDGFPVGFAKETYQGHDYVGYTCAACHTGQVNYEGQSIRIDGGPAMADMVGFLTDLQKSMLKTLTDDAKKQRFIEKVLAIDNDYGDAEGVISSLQEWTNTIQLYNIVNHSRVKYGYARLDAFGRIYNRVLQHMINKEQLEHALNLAIGGDRKRILTNEQIDKVLDGINETIIVDKEFGLIIERLISKEPGYPGLSKSNTFRVRNQIFNEPNAPVSYPFLWDIAQSDYVQWNGLADNAGVGPLGRNTGEVIGVFGILDWTSHKKTGFSLGASLNGQKKKNEQVDFKSSIDLINLENLESHLKSLKSPEWPENIFGSINEEMKERGRVIYSQYCISCHDIVDRSNWDRIIVAKMTDVDAVGTDTAMAHNSVNYHGKSGNLKHTVQAVGVGNVLIGEDAPVVQILTSATKGVIATPDADKMFLRRWMDRLYVIGSSYFKNTLPSTVKSGNYRADTTSSPYNSLLAYKGRSLNGIWATAPYLHNGSVPTLYDLMLPKKREGDPEDGEYRPNSFRVGSREFDQVKVGFRSEGYDGFEFEARSVGDMNSGHEYSAGRTPQADGTMLPALTRPQRLDLIEFIKSL